MRTNNDQAMCATNDCPAEHLCLRKLMMPGDRQVWAEFKPEIKNEHIDCEGFIYAKIG